MRGNAAITKSAQIRGEQRRGFTEQLVDEMRGNAAITKSAQIGGINAEDTPSNESMRCKGLRRR